MVRVKWEMHESIYQKELPTANKKLKPPSTPLPPSSPLWLSYLLKSNLFSLALRNGVKNIEFGLCHLLRLPVLWEGMFGQVHATAEKYLWAREKKLKCGVAEKKKQRPTTPTLEALYHYIKGAFWFRLYPKLESTTSDYDDNIWHMGGLHDPLESKSGQNGILRYFPGLLERNVLISSYLRILLLNESRTAPRSRKSILVNCMNCFRPLGDYWASSSGRATHAPESVCLFIRGLEHRKERTEFWVQAQWWALGRYYRTARRMEVY